ncbi:MAG: hypothetical protein Q9191_002820 [Dirinaria sp. TL-2023a]
MDSTVQERAATAVENALQELKASNKRKRDASDHGGEGKKRGSTSSNVNGNGHEDWTTSDQDFSALSQQLARHSGTPQHGQGNHNTPGSTAAAALAGMMPTLTVPQPTDISFASTATVSDGDRQLDSSFDMGGPENEQNHHSQGTPYNLGNFQGTAAQVQAARESANAGIKPAVGSAEWHKVRKDNHKEVERRRRETINEGINELAKIVPGCEKNKGSILQRAVQYITQLRNNESQNIDKWTFEKVLTDQALQNVSAKNDTLRTKLNRARSDAEKYKKICRDAGLNLENDDDDEDDAGDTDADGDS